ncbi:MAG: hypothetical protein IJV49_03595 [Aeriscardovia sp.]|nr:hypothetical protein [Aeriscardovia sp.]
MGPEKQIPDLQEQLGRIFAKKIYGIAITGLTGLMPRRSLYCTKDAGNEYNVADFEDQQGNIRFRRIEHTWKNGKCRYGNTSKEEVRPGNRSGD